MFAAVKMTYPQPEWVTLSQVRVGTGYAKTFGGDRIIDALTINMYPSKFYKCIAMEFKRTLNDLMIDIADPLKHAAIQFYTDEFYYVFDHAFYQKNAATITVNILSKAHAGIMLIRNGHIRIERKQYHTQYKSPWSFGFVCSMLRNANRQVKRPFRHPKGP